MAFVSLVKIRHAISVVSEKSFSILRYVDTNASKPFDGVIIVSFSSFDGGNVFSEFGIGCSEMAR
jgi:hypothetical protein